MTRNEKGHRSDENTAYLSETLEPEEKAAFEAHLADCKECQEELAAKRALFDDVNKALAFKRKRSIDEQVARFEAEVAAERAAASAKVGVETSVKASGPARRYRRRWALPAAVALAASAAAVFMVLGRPGAAWDRGRWRTRRERMPVWESEGSRRRVGRRGRRMVEETGEVPRIVDPLPASSPARGLGGELAKL